MKLLFLFFTQSEGGAPGYLSRRGEEAAESLADSLGQFLGQSLGVDVASGFDDRARSLEEDIRWRAFRSPASVGEAVAASLRLYSDVLLMAGGRERTLNTARAVSSRLALPVTVDARADGVPGEKGPSGVLADVLTDLVGPPNIGGGEGWLTPAQAPRAVVMGTSVEALGAWLSTRLPAEQHASLVSALSNTTQDGLFPTVFACGFDRDETSGHHTWMFD